MCDRPDGRRRVAGEHLEVDLLGGEEGDGLGGVRAQPLAEDCQSERLHIVGEPGLRAVGRDRLREAPEREHPAAGAGLLPRPGRQRAVRSGEALGRAQYQPLVAEIQSAPAPAGGERHLALDRARLDIGEPGVGDRLEGRVPRRRARGVTGKFTPERVFVHARSGDELDDAQRGLGERAGLIGAKRVDRRQ